MFDHRRLGEQWAHDGAPFLEGWRLAEVHGVVFERLPFDHEQVASRKFDPLLHFPTLGARGLRDDLLETALDGLVEFGLLAGFNADVSNFEDHRLLLYQGRYEERRKATLAA
jgi:hypothetical protein